MVFGVYQTGVRIFVDEDTYGKGTRAGFAVGGFSQSKGDQPLEFLRVDPGFVMINIESDAEESKSSSEPKGTRGGFAVGGFTSAVKGLSQEFLRVTPDSVRILCI